MSILELSTFDLDARVGSWDGHGAQGRTTPILLNHRLSEKWDNKSSHMILMLSGASVPPPLLVWLLQIETQAKWTSLAVRFVPRIFFRRATSSPHS
jgi:hypothetical protein